MANKSNLNVVIDNGGGVVLKVQDDASGYLIIEMNDGKNIIDMKLASADAQALSQAFMYGNAIRKLAPQS